MAGGTLLGMEIARVSHVDAVEYPGQGLLSMGDTDNMDMVRHQAESPDIQAVAEGVLSQPIEIANVVLTIIKDGLAVVAPLDDKVSEAVYGGTG